MEWLVGIDPMSERLAVVPIELAEDDVAAIQTLQAAKNLGDVRQSAPALKLARQWYDPDRTDKHLELDTLPDEAPFDVEQWLGDLWQPLVRLRTAESAPPELLAEFGREDHEFGMDYERARWLAPEDRTAVEGRLRARGDEVRHDESILRAYLG